MRRLVYRSEKAFLDKRGEAGAKEMETRIKQVSGGKFKSAKDCGSYMQKTWHLIIF